MVPEVKSADRREPSQVGDVASVAGFTDRESK